MKGARSRNWRNAFRNQVISKEGSNWIRPSTSSANIVNGQRMRKAATLPALWPRFSSDCESLASSAAISRVTRAVRRAGSSESRSVQMARSRVCTS